MGLLSKLTKSTEGKTPHYVKQKAKLDKRRQSTKGTTTKELTQAHPRKAKPKPPRIVGIFKKAK